MPMQILVFGSPKPECKNCRAAEHMVEDLIDAYRSEVDYQKLTLDSEPARKLGIMATPAIVVNDKILTHGELPRREELARFLTVERLEY